MRIARRRRPRGLTLVELMAALATLTMVLGVCASLVAMLLKFAASGRDHARDEAAVARFARLFREDVRGADDVYLEPTSGPATRLELSTGGEYIVAYVGTRTGVVRTEGTRSEMLKSESIHLPTKTVLRFERQSIAGGEVISAVLTRKARSPGGAKPHDFRIDASFNAHSRFSPKGAT